MVSFFTEIWNQFLFEPMFNTLIWFYNNWTQNSLGWAVIFLTIMLRFALLPLTIINERNKAKNKGLGKEIEKIEKEFKDDPVLKKQKIRETLKEKRIRPWAKAASLGVQVIALILLYEVFLYGITGERLTKFLYGWVDFPGQINTTFLGFDLGATHNSIWAGIVAGWLFIETYFENKRSEKEIEKKDLLYLIAFPGAVFLILWILPAVKALFILTSMVFTLVTGFIVKVLVKPTTSKS